MKTARIFCLAAVLAIFRLSASAEDWPQWRGPHFNGTSMDTGLPTNWSKTNVTWSAALPGAGAATPVIVGDRVFLSAPEVTSSTLHALCFDRKTGKLVWDRTVLEGKTRRDERSNFASPSAAADEQRVFYFFGNGLLVAFDHAGKELWKRNICSDYGDFAINWTFASTPLLYGGRLYLQVLQRDVPVKGHGEADKPNYSYLLAMDPATGKTLWRQIRPTDAVLESHEAYSSPVPVETAGRKQIVLLGADYLTGHDPETGTEIWRSPNIDPTKKPTWPQISSPVAGAGLVLTCQPQKSAMSAIRIDGQGALPASAIVWNAESNRDVGSDVPTPAFYDGDFFVVGDLQKNLFRVEGTTGKVKWRLALGGKQKFEASPTLADGKIYLMNFGGDAVIVNAADGVILNWIPMGDEGETETRSSIAVADGQLFIRTNHKLYCVGRSRKRLF